MQPIREGNWQGVDQNFGNASSQLVRLRAELTQVRSYMHQLAQAVSAIPLQAPSRTPTPATVTTSRESGISWVDVWNLLSPSYWGLWAGNNAGTPATIVDVTAHWALLWTSGGTPLRVNTVSVSINTGNTGANGRDTVAALAVSTWHYIYLIGNGTVTAAGLISASATAPTMPTGYTYKLLVGAVYKDSGGNFHLFNQIGSVVSYESGYVCGTGLPGTAAWATVNCAVYIPPISRRGIFHLYITEDGATTVTMAIRPYGSTGTGTIYYTVGPGLHGEIQDICGVNGNQQLQVNVPTQSFWAVDCVGFVMPTQ